MRKRARGADLALPPKIAASVFASTSSMIDHRLSYRLPVGWGSKFGDDAATCHDANAIGEGENLVEIVADENYRRSGCSGSQESRVNGGSSAHVDTAAPGVRHDDRRV